MHGTIQRKRLDPRWTEAEDDVLRQHWPDRKAVEALLPHRSTWAIKGRAKAISATVRVVEKDMTGAEVKRLKALCECFSSYDVIAAIMGRKAGTIRHLMHRRGWHLKKPALSKSGSALFDEVRQRAFDMGISFADLDRSLGYAHQTFARSSAADKVSIGMIAKAAEALGGRMVIEWEPLDGEDVPTRRLRASGHATGLTLAGGSDA